MPELPSTDDRAAKQPQLPSMDDILRDGRKREKRADLTIGMIVTLGALAFLLTWYALVSGAEYRVYLVPAGALVFGLSRIARGLSA